jgi:hypothetical protein
MDFKIVSLVSARHTQLTWQRKAFKRDVPDFFETLLGGSFRSFVSPKSCYKR